MTGEVPDSYVEYDRISFGTSDCPSCGRPLTIETFHMPCCGGDCGHSEWNTLRMCDHCRRYAYDW